MLKKLSSNTEPYKPIGRPCLVSSKR